VATGLRKYAGGGSDDLVEIAELAMNTGDGSTANACARGKAVAAAVWSKLPSAQS
jgi:hypothetical protein